MSSNDVRRHHHRAHAEPRSCGGDHHHAHRDAHSCGAHNHRAHGHQHAEPNSCAGHHHHAHARPCCGHGEVPAACGSHTHQPPTPQASSQAGEACAPNTDASERQAKVLSVMRSDLSESEKAARIHAIFHPNRKTTSETNTTSGSSDNFPGAGALAGCMHYERKCWVRAECCAKYYPCRRCHDEAEDHEIERSEIKYIACTVCGDKDQPLAPTCRTCGVRFARYFCEPCKMYNDSATKLCFHCDKCGICRVGRQEDNYHCDDCGTCMPKDRQFDHPCRSRNFDSNCPICHEHLATTTEEIFVLQCTHPIHAKCFDEYAQAGNFACPLCQKAMFDRNVMEDWYKKIDERILLDEMPEEFERKMSEVFCNDCETKTTTKFHFRFHKCKDCGGYNTSVLNQFDADDNNIKSTGDTRTDTNENDNSRDAPNDTEDEGGGTTAPPPPAELMETVDETKDTTTRTNFSDNDISGNGDDGISDDARSETNRDNL